MDCSKGQKRRIDSPGGWDYCRALLFPSHLSHGAEDGVVAADGGAVLVVLGLRVADLVELRLKRDKLLGQVLI